MSILPHHGGYYDDKGQWQRTKFCFTDCGANCTCKPPNGNWYSPLDDKRYVPQQPAQPDKREALYERSDAEFAASVVRVSQPASSNDWLAREARQIGLQPAQPLDVSHLPMGDPHPIDLVKAGCDPITGQPAQPDYKCACLEFWDSHHPECPTGLGRTEPAQPEPVEAVEAVGYEHDDGTLYGYANHKSYAGNPGAIPVRIMRESDYAALTASRAQVAALERERDALKRAIDEPAPDVQEAVLRRLGLLNARDQLTAAQQRIAELETLNAERNRQNAAAFAAVERMRAKLLELAGECANCHGSNSVTIKNFDGNGSDADDQPCPDCKDIRQVANG